MLDGPMQNRWSSADGAGGREASAHVAGNHKLPSEACPMLLKGLRALLAGRQFHSSRAWGVVTDPNIRQVSERDG